jgi:hypothetical protein
MKEYRMLNNGSQLILPSTFLWVSIAFRNIKHTLIWSNKCQWWAKCTVSWTLNYVAESRNPNLRTLYNSGRQIKPRRHPPLITMNLKRFTRFPVYNIHTLFLPIQHPVVRVVERHCRIHFYTLGIRIPVLPWPLQLLRDCPLQLLKETMTDCFDATAFISLSWSVVLSIITVEVYVPS